MDKTYGKSGSSLTGVVSNMHGASTIRVGEVLALPQKIAGIYVVCFLRPLVNGCRNESDV